MVGRPRNPNIHRAFNLNGIEIPCYSAEYKRLLKTGYKLNKNKTRFILDNTFTGDRNIPLKRGRPPKYPASSHQTVINPDSKREIKTNTALFRILERKYGYDNSKNVFLMYVPDPKNPNESIVKYDDKFNKYLKRGYIYNENNNSIIIPSQKTKEAFDGEVQSHGLLIVDKLDVEKQMKSIEPRIKVLLERYLKKFNGVKFNTGFKIQFYKVVDPETEKIEKVKVSLNAKASTITNKSEFRRALRKQREGIQSHIDRFTNGGSGWIIHRIIKQYFNIYKYKPLRGKGYIELPKSIQNRGATVNIKNNDDKCFIYCLGRRFDPNPKEKNLNRVTKHLKKVCSDLGFDKIRTPVKPKDIPKIEKQFGITVNLFYHNDGEIYPKYINNNVVDESKHINILLTTKEDGNNILSHYVWIKDFNSLNYRQTKHKNRKHFCVNCLQGFSSAKVLERHKSDCIILNGAQAVEFPKEGSTLEFKSLHKSLPVPFVIYADLEAILKLLSKKNMNKNNNDSYTVKTHEHITCSYGYKVVCHEDKKYSRPYKSYCGPDAVYKFFEDIFEEEQRINKYLIQFCKSKMDKMTQDEWKKYNKAKCCYICNNEFTKKNFKVRDHNHITNKFRGAACDTCNKQYRLSHIIPVVFHNLKGYDMKLLLQEVGRFKTELSVIPLNMEKYMSFSIKSEKVCWDYKKKDYVPKSRFDLRFIDSFQFLPSSLSALVENLKQKGLTKFNYLKQEVGDENLELLTRKGIYPYSYIDSWEKFDVHTNKLLKEHFTNDLTGDEISDSDYSFYKLVCKQLKLKTLRDYHDLYLKTDVLLLADVFENFRKTSLEYYNLDPCHYYTAPGLSWDACLKMTGIELELISDPDMYLFIEKGLKGGLSVISQRRGNANNKYMKNYNKESPSKFISYFDANNLYGWAMVQSLPYGGFKWVNPNKFDLDSVNKNAKKGYILEVDLEYPKELHDLHNEYPYCPEHIKVTDDMLSDYCKGIAKEHDVKPSKYTKLISSLGSKVKYVIHERNLKQAIDAGLILKKIHRVLEFRQKPWMKKYIEFNTEKRKMAKNDFEKDFFKLMNNSVFGKTMENVRNRKNFKLICDSVKFEKYVAKPNFINGVIFNENLVGVHYIQEKLMLNKPIYVGFSILDISKTLMYDFHYGYIKKKYGNKAKLLFTDTDSLCYEIKTRNLYKDMYNNRKNFDLSELSGAKFEKYNDETNKKVLGKFKLECPNTIAKEFIGLKSKMYSISYEDGLEVKKAKGIVKSVIKKDLRHEKYNDILTSGSKMYSKMKVIRSEKHRMYTMELNKISLSAYDDKRFIKKDGIHSYAYGHYKILK